MGLCMAVQMLAPAEALPAGAHVVGGHAGSGSGAGWSLDVCSGPSRLGGGPNGLHSRVRGGRADRQLGALLHSKATHAAGEQESSNGRSQTTES